MITPERYKERLERTHETLDSISPSFCLAKWLQTTLYLQNGFNHSCHHPTPHKITLDEIDRNYKALHNTQFKKEKMQDMIDGIRPKECEYCWKVEDLGKNYISDRIYKSASNWALPNLGKVIENGTDDIAPTYLEISFSNVCNFKCAYCSPDLSSKWYEEIQQHGGYPTSNNFNNFEYLKQIGKMPYKHSEHNPYVEAFWKWWPEIYPTLHTLRLTGGEPLLSKDVWKVLDYVENNPNPSMTFCINTNLCSQDSFIDQLIEKINKISKNVKEIQIFTSGEAVGKDLEYIRYGMDYDKWKQNLEKVLDNTDCIVAVMTTVNLTNIPTYAEFLRYLLDLREKYNTKATFNKVQFMTNYLRYPEFLSLTILDDISKNKFTRSIEKLIMDRGVGNYNGIGSLSYFEIDQLNRMIDHMKDNTVHGKEEIVKRDFVNFINEYDRRRNLNFVEVFPSLKDFYNQCVAL